VHADAIDLDGAKLRGLEEGVWGARMTAYGSREGAPFVLIVDESGRTQAHRLPGEGFVTSVAGYESTLVATQNGSEARLFAIPGLDDGPGTAEPVDDAFSRSARRLWVVNGSEDPAYVVSDTTGRLSGVDPAGVGFLPEAGRLRLATPDAPLLVGQDEVPLYVAGALADGESRPRASLWQVSAQGTHEVASQVDEFTDANNGWPPCFSGLRRGKPILLTCGGAEMELPPAHVDARRANVRVARHPFANGVFPPDWRGWWYAPGLSTPAPEGTQLVLQSSTGIELWTRTAAGWDLQRLPGRELLAARSDALDESVLWYVADGGLWRVSL
jgi:hypothetical protein